MAKNGSIFSELKNDAIAGTQFFFVFYGIAWLIKKIVLLPFSILVWLFALKNKTTLGIVPGREQQIIEFERLIEGLPAGDQLRYKQAAEKNPELVPRFLEKMKQIGYIK